MLDIADEHLVVYLGDGLEELVATLLRLFLVLLGDRLRLRSLVILPEDERYLVDEVDHTLEGVFLAHRDLDGERAGHEALADHVDDVPEVR
ncbi:MAG: hypothetical protein ACRD1Z_07290, partial [Vicinamibacteria bacterium]